MSSAVLMGLFLLIVFAPCLVALLSNGLDDSEFPEILGLNPSQRSANEQTSLVLQAMLPEISLAEDFEIRNFPKGISQRRLLVRDGESGVKLTIQQVRAAAVELVKLGGMVAAYEFALVAAASATAMRNVKDAFALAAREVMDAAQHAYAWLETGDGARFKHHPGAWSENLAPPIEVPRRLDHLRWRESEDLDDLDLTAAAA